MKAKNKAAAGLGRKGGKARARNLSPKELSDQGRNAVQARWDTYYKAHPEKLRKKKTREGIKKRGEKEGV